MLLRCFRSSFAGRLRANLVSLSPVSDHAWSLNNRQITVAALESSPKPRDILDQTSESAGLVSADAGTEGQHHAVISTFDLFSIGIGPSSSHTIGPARAARIFVQDLKELGVLDQVASLKVTLYGSLAATGKGHMTPMAIMLGLEDCDFESLDLDPATLPIRYNEILESNSFRLKGLKLIKFRMDRDMLWIPDVVLPQHPNGMRFTVFNSSGDMIATNTYFSTGGGFVANEKTLTQENVYYRSVVKSDAAESRRLQGPDDSVIEEMLQPQDTSSENIVPKPKALLPPYPFVSGDSLLAQTKAHNMTIAQITYENELFFWPKEEVHAKLNKIWHVMNESIRQGLVSKETNLPGVLNVRRRAPELYARLHQGLYPSLKTNEAGEGKSLQVPKIIGRTDHHLSLISPRKTVFPSIDYISAYAIAVNEVNAAGGRVVTAPTLGAAGIIPATLKYILEFISHDHERDIHTFLLTAAAIGMLYKRGATISAAEGGCMAEVGVASSMAAAGFAACLGGTPEIIEQAAEIALEHSLGLTCDPLLGEVQIPCIERNVIGATKSIASAQLALAGSGEHLVSLDDIIKTMRVTAAEMSHKVCPILLIDNENSWLMISDSIKRRV